MNKNAIIAVLGIAVVVLLVVILRPRPPRERGSEPERGTNSPPNEIVRPPLQPDAVNRLWDGKKRITTIAEVSGHGAYGKYGVEGTGDFYYSATVDAVSEILSKSKTDYGEIRIEERREFKTAKDVFHGGHFDVKLALSKTLPVEKLYESTLAVGVLVGRLFPVTGTVIVETDIAIKQLVDKVDETSLRGLLRFFGTTIPEDVEDRIDELVNKWLEGQFGPYRVLFQKVQGKSYRIVYTEKASGEPVHVTFTAEDGSIPSDEELAVLRSANIFLDSLVVPGDVFDEDRHEWDVSADALDEVFGSVADGTCKGTFTFHRKADTPSGDWELSADPGKVEFLNEKGRVTGALELSSGGVGIVDPTNKYVRALQFAGKGNLEIRKTTRRVLLFDMMKSIEGECEYSFRYATEHVVSAPVP